MDLTTKPGADPIIVKGFFAASSQRVFQAWTDARVVMKWFGRAPNSLLSASIDLRPGGAWKFLEAKDDRASYGFEGEYLEIEPEKRLVFTWTKVVEQFNGKREATPVSRVEVTFEASGSGTCVRVVHSSVHDHDTRTAFGGGWTFGLNTMRDLLCGRVGLEATDSRSGPDVDSPAQVSGGHRQNPRAAGR